METTDTRLVTEAALAAALHHNGLGCITTCNERRAYPDASPPLLADGDRISEEAHLLDAKDIFAALPERPALDVEVLARAIDASWSELLAPLGGLPDGLRRSAESIAAEYERLSRERAGEGR